MYLHASELELTIPGGSKEKNQRKVFTSEIPEDFNNVL
jgi:hypothetical protein